MYQFARQALFSLDPELAHDLTIKALKKTGRSPLKCLYTSKAMDKPVTVMGLEFKNPLGLAAGLDKNGECIDAFGAMGFGFVEVGTVTPRPQAGNPKKRLFRLPAAQAIINRMGFNNKGVDYLVSQVKQSNYQGVLGINIGKNKDTPNEKGKDDYIACMRKTFEHASYITVNISSPNTPGLRDLQHGEALNELLSSLKNEQLDLAAKHNKQVPLVVKLAPDMDQEQVAGFAQTLLDNQIDAVCATNTTLSREAVKGLPFAEEQGGLSGHPLHSQSLEIIRQLKQHLGDRMPIIGVGGIDSGDRAKASMQAGAQLLQVYSGFIYHGPDLIKKIVNAI